jgi:predicted dehydrogenase
MTQRALVIGYGSIGQRHVNILQGLGLEVSVLSQRDAFNGPTYRDIPSALSTQATAPDFVVIANETSAHAATLTQLAQTEYTGRVLVEKPLFATREDIPHHTFSQAGVAYNLRFHPMMQALVTALGDAPILTINAMVGQYLPDWRPGRDYRDTYSASAELGGGVLLDLSHDIDLVCLLAGKAKHVTGLGGHLSSLELDSEDSFALLSTHEKCPVVSLMMNYLDRRSRREIVVQTDDHTFKADFIANTLTIDKQVQELDPPSRDDSYLKMHQAMLGVQTDATSSIGPCSFADGYNIVNFIETVKGLEQTKDWGHLG